MQVEHIPLLAESPPDRPRVVDEQRRMLPQHAHGFDLLAGSRLEDDHRPAGVRPATAQERDVHAQTPQGPFASTPLVHGRAVRDPQCTHGTS